MTDIGMFNYYLPLAFTFSNFPSEIPKLSFLTTKDYVFFNLTFEIIPCSVKMALKFYFISDGVKDWAESQLIRIYNCNRLIVSLGKQYMNFYFKCIIDYLYLGSDNNAALHRTLSKSKVVILFENIRQLELSNLDIGHNPTQFNKRDKITSIIFRYKKIFIKGC